MRIGARRGEVLKEEYALARDGGKKSDIMCWYIDRPKEGGIQEEETRQQDAL